LPDLGSPGFVPNKVLTYNADNFIGLLNKCCWSNKGRFDIKEVLKLIRGAKKQRSAKEKKNEGD